MFHLSPEKKNPKKKKNKNKNKKAVNVFEINYNFDTFRPISMKPTGILDPTNF